MPGADIRSRVNSRCSTAARAPLPGVAAFETIRKQREGSAEDEPAGANLVISQLGVEFEDVEAAVEGVYEEIAAAVPNLERGATDEIAFDDGVAGYYVDVSFWVGPEQRIIQRHAVRLDGELLTHLVLSVDVTQQPRLAELLPLLRSFHAERPS